MTPGRQDDAYPGWQWVVDATGLGGWVPADLLAGDAILADFDTTELTVAAGAVVTVLESRLGWARVRDAQGRTGWLPKDCL